MKENFYSGESIFSAGGALINKQTQKVYLIYKESSDEWLLPKGRIEKGESIEDTAKREIYEETGYQSLIHDLLWIQIRPDIKNPDIHKIIFWFLAILEKEERTSNTQKSDESFSGTWFTKDEAIDKLSFDEDRKMIVKSFSSLP